MGTKIIFDNIKRKNIGLSFLVRKTKMHKIFVHDNTRMELSIEIFHSHMPNFSPNNIIY